MKVSKHLLPTSFSIAIILLASCSISNNHSLEPSLKLKTVETINDLSYFYLKIKNNGSEDIFLTSLSLYNSKNDFESLEYIPNKLTYPDYLRKRKSGEILIVLDCRIDVFEINIKTKNGQVIELKVAK